MRKKLGLTVLLLSGLASAHLLFPEWTDAKWRQLLVLSGKQLEAELATVEELKSGRLRLGALRGQSPEQQKASPLTAPVSAFPRKSLTGSQKTSPSLPKKSVGTAATTAPLQKPVPESHSQTSSSGPSPSVEPVGDEMPESRLGAILKHENRAQQMKEETYWTEEKVQEAIQNGAPKQRSAPCIAFCDKKDTMIEINTPD